MEDVAMRAIKHASAAPVGAATKLNSLDTRVLTRVRGIGSYQRILAKGRWMKLLKF